VQHVLQDTSMQVGIGRLQSGRIDRLAYKAGDAIKGCFHGRSTVVSKVVQYPAEWFWCHAAWFLVQDRRGDPITRRGAPLFRGAAWR